MQGHCSVNLEVRGIHGCRLWAGHTNSGGQGAQAVCQVAAPQLFDFEACKVRTLKLQPDD